jgi:hypothetical protein
MLAKLSRRPKLFSIVNAMSEQMSTLMSDDMNEGEYTQLSVPPDVIAEGGDEVLRAFVINGGLSIAIQRAFEDPATWGRLLMDVARYVAGLYGRETELSEQEALAHMMRVLKDEIIKSETSDMTGLIN